MHAKHSRETAFRMKVNSTTVDPGVLVVSDNSK